jgi:hypothetical protein
VPATTRRIGIMSPAIESTRGPVLLCYDGSDAAGRAIEHAARMLGGEAIVLTVWSRWAP